MVIVDPGGRRRSRRWKKFQGQFSARLEVHELHGLFDMNFEIP